MEGKLPPSAITQRSWWANDSVGHVQSKRWLDAGWRVRSFNLTNRTVIFTRIVERQLAYVEFFSNLLQSLREQSRLPVKQSGPTGANWHSCLPIPVGSPQMAQIATTFTYDKRFRIELYIDTGNKDKNKAVFDSIRAQLNDSRAPIVQLLTKELYVVSAYGI
jgi:hypothetical protein